MLSEKLKEDLRNPWLRGILLVIGTTVTVNVAFITYAFISPPNLVVQDYYERGKNYFHDENIRKEGLPTAWRLQLMLPDKLKLDTPEMCRLYVMDHGGTPVKSGKVVLNAYHVSGAGHDFKLQLSQADVGTFTGPVTFPFAGSWDLIARIDAGEQHFDTAKRIFVEK